MSVKIADLLKVLRMMHPVQLMADSYAEALKNAEELLCGLGLADRDKAAAQSAPVYHTSAPVYHGPMSAPSLIPVGASGSCSPQQDDVGKSTCKGSWPYCKGGTALVFDRAGGALVVVPCPVCAMVEPMPRGGKSTSIDPVRPTAPVDEDAIGPEDHPAPLPERKDTKPRYMGADYIRKRDILHCLSVPGYPLSFDALHRRLGCDASRASRDALQHLLDKMRALGDVRHEGGIYSLPRAERNKPSTLSEQEAVEPTAKADLPAAGISDTEVGVIWAIRRGDATWQGLVDRLYMFDHVDICLAVTTAREKGLLVDRSDDRFDITHRGALLLTVGRLQAISKREEAIKAPVLAEVVEAHKQNRRPHWTGPGLGGQPGRTVMGALQALIDDGKILFDGELLRYRPIGLPETAAPEPPDGGKELAPSDDEVEAAITQLLQATGSSTGPELAARLGNFPKTAVQSAIMRMSDKKLLTVFRGKYSLLSS